MQSARLLPSVRSSHRILQRALASLSAFCSEIQALDGCWPSAPAPLKVRLTDSLTVPHSRLAPSPANPTALPSGVAGTARSRGRKLLLPGAWAALGGGGGTAAAAVLLAALVADVSSSWRSVTPCRPCTSGSNTANLSPRLASAARMPAAALADDPAASLGPAGVVLLVDASSTGGADAADAAGSWSAQASTTANCSTAGCSTGCCCGDGGIGAAAACCGGGHARRAAMPCPLTSAFNSWLHGQRCREEAQCRPNPSLPRHAPHHGQQHTNLSSAARPTTIIKPASTRRASSNRAMAARAQPHCPLGAPDSVTNYLSWISINRPLSPGC